MNAAPQEVESRFDPSIPKGVVVIDGFTPYPDAARQSALDAGFGTWRPNKGEIGSSVYEGMCFWGDHAKLLGPLMWHMGAQCVPNSMFFRSTNAGFEGAYVHSDRESGDFTAIVYLSEHEADGSGTAFWRHIATGLDRMPSFDELRAEPERFEQLRADMVSADPAAWERIAFIPGKLNRGLIFQAPMFHSRCPREGFGETPDEGRMVWVSHFMMLRGPSNG
ncbi:MAG: DUF6445 family protein [Sphingopyxis sp.]